MEIVDAPNAVPDHDPVFDQFKLSRSAALESSAPGSDGQGLYRNAGGETIRYLITESRPEILDVNGVAKPDFTTTSGDLITSDGKGNVTIRGPVTSPSILINFTDWANPRVTP